MLLKLKLLQDNIDTRLVRKVLAAKQLPQELWVGIETAVVRSPLSTQLHKKSSVQLLAMELEIVRHIKILGARLAEANDNVVYGLLRPDEWLGQPPQMYSPGSPEEMQLLLDYNYQAWWQTEGALELLENSRKNAEKDSADEIEDMLEHNEDLTLEDVSFDRIWGYFDWAVEDAASLATERPSDVHVKTAREFWKAAREEEDNWVDYSDDGQ
jgi:hypothetical protein